MYRKFASIAFASKFGYAYDSMTFNAGRSPFLLSEFRAFETYGDGLIQHSSDWAVGEDLAIDFLMSLAVAMLDDTELADAVDGKLNRHPTDGLIAFAAGLVFNPDKDRWPNKVKYFSVSEQKASRNEKLQHDKRYNELKEWHDGTPLAVYQMITPDWAEGLVKWQYATAIRAWFQINNPTGSKYYMEPASMFLKGFGSDPDKAREFHNAFDACHAICKAHRLSNLVKDYRERIERDAQKAAEAQQQAPETATTTVSATIRG